MPLLLFFFSAVTVYFYLVKTGEDSPEGDIPIPEEYPAGTISYSPTEKQAVFAVEDVNSDSGVMLLRFIFPADRRNTLVSSKISCPLEDSWVVETDNNGEITQRTLSNVPLYSFSSSFASQEVCDGDEICFDTLQGICEDESCNVISKDCELYTISK